MNDQAPSPGYTGAVIRTVGTLVGGYLVAKGTISAEDAPAIGGALLSVGTGLWSLYSKYKASQRLKAAIAAPAGKAA